MAPKNDDERLHDHLLVLTRSLPQLVWTSHDSGRWMWASPRWTEYTGLDDKGSQDDHWLMAVHPDDRETVAEAWKQADLSGLLDVEHRLLSLKHPDEAHWFHTRATPLPDLPGQERVWLGTCTEVHDTRLYQERVTAVQTSSQRQVSELLRLIRSVVRDTLKADEAVGMSAARLDSRLEAISRVQLMLGNPDKQVQLAELVLEGLLAHAAHEGEAVRIHGPPLFLKGVAAELLGLAVHELAMNAVEHGALVMPQGRVEVAWRVEDDMLWFEWTETELPVPPTGIRRKGFGTELIEATLKFRLGAMTALTFQRTGIRCVIVMPMTDNVTVAAEDGTE